jgi:hypothetical protein
MSAEEKARGKLKNYKLKHSGLLTCYSGLLYLLAVCAGQRTVSPSDAMAMINLTPTERLDWLLGWNDLAQAPGAIRKLIAQYEQFLETVLKLKLLANLWTTKIAGVSWALRMTLAIPSLRD